MWGNCIWEWILQIFTSFNRFFFLDRCGSPLRALWLWAPYTSLATCLLKLWVWNLHLIGLFQSSEFKLLPLGFKNSLVCLLRFYEHLQGCSYVILHSKIGWKKVKICWFGWRKWFSLSIRAEFAMACKWHRMISTCKKECNKFDLTFVQCLWLVNHNNLSRWFAISSPSPICCPSFSFMGENVKK